VTTILYVQIRFITPDNVNRDTPSDASMVYHYRCGLYVGRHPIARTSIMVTEYSSSQNVSD